MTLSRQPAYWLFVLLVLTSIGLVGAQQLSYLTAYPQAWFLSVVLLAAVAIPVGIVIYRLDQFEPEPASLIVVALVWGGVVSLAFAAVVNTAFLTFLQHVMSTRSVDSWGASIVAPIDEEFYKGAGLVMIYLIARHEIDGLMDGLVYGAMIGLGFQVMEDIQYFVHAAAQTQGGGVGGVIGTFFVRVLIAGLYSHMLFTGLTGFGFAYFITRRGTVSWARRAGTFALFVLAAWAAHFVWNSPWLGSLQQGGAGRFILVLVIKGLPFLILLLIMGIEAARDAGLLPAHDRGGGRRRGDPGGIPGAAERSPEAAGGSGDEAQERPLCQALGQAHHAGADEPGPVPCEDPGSRPCGGGGSEG
jgi:RsiW-degrading membrane proteinase PrsW (M82 family)